MINVPRSLALLVLPVFKHSISLHLLKAICTTLWFSKVTLTLLCIALLIYYFPKYEGKKHFFESNQMKSNMFNFLDFNTNCGKLQNLRILSTFMLSNCMTTMEDVGRIHETPRSKIKVFIPYSKGINSLLPSWLHCPKRAYTVFLFNIQLRIWGGVAMKYNFWTCCCIYELAAPLYYVRPVPKTPLLTEGDMRSWLLLVEG